MMYRSHSIYDIVQHKHCDTRETWSPEGWIGWDDLNQPNTGHPLAYVAQSRVVLGGIVLHGPMLHSVLPGRVTVRGGGGVVSRSMVTSVVYR